MPIPRQLAPTVGLAHGGVEFLEGSISGIEILVIDRKKKESAQNDRMSHRTTISRAGEFIEIMVNFGADRYKVDQRQRNFRVYVRRPMRGSATRRIGRPINIFCCAPQVAK